MKIIKENKRGDMKKFKIKENIKEGFYFLHETGYRIGPFKTKKLRNKIQKEHWNQVAMRQDYASINKRIKE